MLISNPFEWAVKNIKPRFEKAGMSMDTTADSAEREKAVDFLSKAFSNRNAGEFFAALLANQSVIRKDQPNLAKAKGPEAAEAVREKDPGVAFAGVTEQVYNLIQGLSEGPLKQAIPLMNSFSDAIARVNSTLSKNPEVQKDVGVIAATAAATAGAGLAGSGLTTLGMAGLGGILTAGSGAIALPAIILGMRQLGRDMAYDMARNSKWSAPYTQPSSAFGDMDRLAQLRAQLPGVQTNLDTARGAGTPLSQLTVQSLEMQKVSIEQSIKETEDRLHNIGVQTTKPGVDTSAIDDAQTKVDTLKRSLLELGGMTVRPGVEPRVEGAPHIGGIGHASLEAPSRGAFADIDFQFARG